MSKYFRYPSVIKNNLDDYVISINIDEYHTGNTILFNLKSTDFPYNLKKNHNIIISDSNVVHNFTIFKDSTNTFYYGLGGLNRNQPHWNENSLNNGLFLYKSYDTIKWENLSDINPIISVNRFPKNPIISKDKLYYEQFCPQCDSNICCLYSKIFKTYLIFVRANIARGCRSTQITTTTDFINFTDFKLLNIDTFIHFNNNYMFKCVEIFDYNVFFALVPFTNKATHPSKYYIKKLISYDMINWIDCGKLCDSNMHKDKVHINTHIAAILYSNNVLEIILHENCACEQSYLKNKTFKINENPLEQIDIKEFICKLIF